MPEAPYRNSIQPPFRSLLTQTPPLDLPRKRHNPFSDNIKARLSLRSISLHSPKQKSPLKNKAYLNRIQNLNNTRMSQSTRLAHRILRQRKPRLIRDNIKGENAAVRAIILFKHNISALNLLREIQKAPYPFRTVMKCPDRIADVDPVAERERE